RALVEELDSRAPVCVIDQHEPEHDEALLPEIDPAQAAYVIYTSGTTGRPKGVVITHHAVARLLDVTHSRFAFQADDVWTMFHSHAFDFSVWEMWGALSTGARLVVVPYWVSRSPEDFARLIVNERVTVLNQTPTAFLPLIDELTSAPKLRLVIFGGEALQPPSLARWFAGFGHERPALVNVCGITETTVHVTHQHVSVRDTARAVSPIGRPIDDLRVTLVDAALGPVPAGDVGEMLVGGPGVARGYLARPRLTAERFVPDAWSGGSGARVYRSGDLGREVDGQLEYIGRNDTQIKLHGFRIEPGE